VDVQKLGQQVGAGFVDVVVGCFQHPARNAADRLIVQFRLLDHGVPVSHDVALPQP
jgi:tryptophanyl-tRNA synthetase